MMIMGGLRMGSRIRIGSWGYAERMEEAEGEKMGWELKRMGKQILVAGLLASSAPMVVPPLVVVSVIGVSLTIPFGIYWASHAWTHKLMSKLLPMPATATPGEGCGKDCVVAVNHARRPAEKKGSEEAVDESESDINMRGDDSHKPVPSAVTAEETIGLHQGDSPAALCLTEINYCAESSSPVVNAERLWGEVNAIRVIVGYEGTPQASCADELKRLYIVAGVEPPSLLSASCEEIHDHLHFLMSILGVKSNSNGP